MGRLHGIVGHGSSCTIEAWLLVGRHFVAWFGEVAIACTLARWSEWILLLPWHHLAAIRGMVWRCIPTNVALGVAGSPVIEVMARLILTLSVIEFRGLAAHCRHLLGRRRNRRRSVVGVALARARDTVLARGVARWCAPAVCARCRNAKFCSRRGRVGRVNTVVVVVVVVARQVTLLVAIVVLLVGDGVAARVVNSNGPPSFSIRREGKANKGQLCKM